MRLRWGHVCRYAESTPTGVTAVGIFDFVAAAPIEKGGPITLPLFYLIALIGATSFEAGKHTIMVRMIDEDGEEGGRVEFPDAAFSLGIPGRELGSYLIHPVYGSTVPHYGDFMFEIWAGEQRLGGVDFTVNPPLGFVMEVP